MWGRILINLNPIFCYDMTISSFNRYCSGCDVRVGLNSRFRGRHRDSTINIKEFKEWACFVSKTLNAYFYSDVSKYILNYVCNLLIHTLKPRCYHLLMNDIQKLTVEPNGLWKMRVSEMKRLYFWMSGEKLRIYDDFGDQFKKEERYKQAIRTVLVFHQKMLTKYYIPCRKFGFETCS